MMADMDGEVEAHLHIHTESVLGLQARTVHVADIPDEHIVLSEGDLSDPTLSSELMDCLNHFGDVDTVTVRVKTQSTRRAENEGEFSWAFVTFETEPDAAAAIEAGLSVPVTKDSETLDVKLKVTQAALTGLKTGTEKSRIVQKHTRSEARPTNTSSLVSHLLMQIQQVLVRSRRCSEPCRSRTSAGPSARNAGQPTSVPPTSTFSPLPLIFSYKSEKSLYGTELSHHVTANRGKIIISLAATMDSLVQQVRRTPISSLPAHMPTQVQEVLVCRRSKAGRSCGWRKRKGRCCSTQTCSLSMPPTTAG